MQKTHDKSVNSSHLRDSRQLAIGRFKASMTSLLWRHNANQAWLQGVATSNNGVLFRAIWLSSKTVGNICSTQKKTEMKNRYSVDIQFIDIHIDIHNYFLKPINHVISVLGFQVKKHTADSV